MLKVEPNSHDTNAEPAPSFATDAEIEIAERLRYELEQRYLAPSEASLPLRARSNEGH